MKVMVDLDRRDVWRIQEQAERLGVQPGDVLRDELAVRRSAASMRKRVKELVNEGLCTPRSQRNCTTHRAGWRRFAAVSG